MPDLWSPQELASRFAAYIDELQEFFDCHHLSHGSPEDVLALAEKLDAPGPFRDELNSMLRAIILRQGGTVPHTELLEILAVASGGTSLDPAAPELQPAMRKLLTVIAGTARRPWNEPPNQLSLEPSPEPSSPTAEPNNVVPFPRRKASAGGDRDLPPPPPDELEIDPSITFANAVARRIAASNSPATTVVTAETEAEPEAETTPPQPTQPNAELSAPTPDPEIEADPEAEFEPAPLSVEAATDSPARKPKLSPSLHHLIMMSGGTVAAALVLVILLMHGHSPAPAEPAATPAIHAQAVAPAAPQPIANQPSAVAPASPKPTADVSGLPAADPAPVHRHSTTSDADEDYVAPPWTGPKPPPIDSTAQPPQSPSSAQPSLTSVATQAPPASDPPATVHTADQTFYRHPAPGSAAGTPSSGGGALSDHPSYLDVSSGVMAGNLISAPMPSYPMLAHLAHIQGEVILQAVIGKDGRVSTARVLSGHRLLRSAAVDAVRRWRYRPYRVDGRPVDVSTIVTVKFHGQK